MKNKAGMRLQIDVTFDPLVTSQKDVAEHLRKKGDLPMLMEGVKAKHSIFTTCPAEDEDPSDLEYPRGTMYPNEIRAIGITNGGKLVKINSPDAARGLALQGLIIAHAHIDWFRKHEPVLRQCFAMNHNHAGTIMVVGGVSRQRSPSYEL